MRKNNGWKLIKVQPPKGINKRQLQKPWLDMVLDIPDPATVKPMPPKGSIPWESRSEADKAYILSLRLEERKGWVSPEIDRGY